MKFEADDVMDHALESIWYLPYLDAPCLGTEFSTVGRAGARHCFCRTLPPPATVPSDHASCKPEKTIDPFRRALGLKASIIGQRQRWGEFILCCWVMKSSFRIHSADHD